MSHKNGAGSSKPIPAPIFAGSCEPPRISCINTYLKDHCLHLGRVIGEGSYSKVRLCTHVNPIDGIEKKIACKVIDKAKASEDFVNKFLPRELEIVSRLKNPNIISVYDVVQFNDHVFIFMDFCNRGDLLEYIKNRGFISERRSKNYFYQLLSAVRYLHGLDLAHRDLKCENILLTHNDMVKISDFGFSRYCHDSCGKRILSNTYCGSAAYAAPEILQGTKYNPKLYDMWSLGCILFIMTTGHMPFDESNIPVMLDNQLKKILPYPLHVTNLISGSAKQLIRHLLEPDVTRRATIEQALSDTWFSEPVVSAGGGDFQTHEEQHTIGGVEIGTAHEIIGIESQTPVTELTYGDSYQFSQANDERPTSSNRTSSKQSKKCPSSKTPTSKMAYRTCTPYPNSSTNNQYLEQQKRGQTPRAGADKIMSSSSRSHHESETGVDDMAKGIEDLKVSRSVKKKAFQAFKRK